MERFINTMPTSFVLPAIVAVTLQPKWRPRCLARDSNGLQAARRGEILALSESADCLALLFSSSPQNGEGAEILLLTHS